MAKTIKAVKVKIAKLNDRIDLKIINGQSYKKEAAQHKDLVVYLNHLMTK